MPIPNDSTFKLRVLPGSAAVIATHWQETGALGVPSVQPIPFELWLELFSLAELSDNHELQEAALYHMRLSATRASHFEKAKCAQRNLEVARVPAS